MDHRIVNEPTKFFKNAAKLELKGRWLEAGVAFGIYVVMIGIVSFIASNIGISFLEGISAIYYWIIYGPACIGLYAYFMRLARRQNPNLRDCFEGFEDFGRSLVLGLLMIVKIFLWTLLFVIPGIIAAYRYSMAPLLMRDHPDWGATQCINESKRLMVGNKGSLFTLDLSFIGWLILSILPALIVSSAYGAVSGAESAAFSFPISLVLLIFEIPVVFVGAYMTTARVVFYEELNRPVEVYTAGRGFHPYNDSGSYGAYDPNGFSGDFVGDDLFDDM